MQGAEQRKSERFDVDLEIRVQMRDAEVVGTITNLSLGGLKVRLDTPDALSVGTRLHVIFSIPTAPAPLEADAEVRWQAELDDSVIGLQFITGFRAKETWALGRFLEQLKTD